jgi:putative Ca2+/H+ antiporter (TMEM165/GDT1 family)
LQAKQASYQQYRCLKGGICTESIALGIYMEKTIFVSTCGLIFLAELGDKNQLTAMALSLRYRPVPHSS